ncbi:baseplate J/gp47 family protein [Thermomonas sp.]|uniref:baseplate assembly protein n=1 Tax=Thermomonas sp. TaxID=1971895 RepID=UPI0035B4E165
MPGTFTAVDLSRLPFPAVVEPLDFEIIFAAMLADLRARAPEFDALVESDPAYKLLEVAAYRELILRQRVNEAAKAVTLAYAAGTDLDHLAANVNVARLLITPANPDALPPLAAVYETDADLRRRVQLAFEGLSTAGPVGAYLFHALGAHGDVLDASVESPTPGVVVVAVLSRVGDGTASPALLDAVGAALNAEDVRPLTDLVQVQSASIVPYAVDAALTLYPGPDAAVVLADAQARLAAYTASNHRLGRDITRAGLIAALCTAGVQNVALATPITDIPITPAQAPWCTAATVAIGGYGE